MASKSFSAIWGSGSEVEVGYTMEGLWVVASWTYGSAMDRRISYSGRFLIEGQWTYISVLVVMNIDLDGTRYFPLVKIDVIVRAPSP